MGYLVYSLFSHIYYRESPDGLEAFVVVFASVLPDLIDKPLAWEYGVFETGYALGHSIFFAVPLSIVVGLLAKRVERPRSGIAFGLGYLLHLPTDVIDGYYRDGVFEVSILLWPIERGASPGHQHDPGFIDQFWNHFGQYLAELTAGDPSMYILAQFGMTLFVFLLWLYDGVPVLAEIVAEIQRIGSKLMD